MTGNGSGPGERLPRVTSAPATPGPPIADPDAAPAEELAAELRAGRAIVLADDSGDGSVGDVMCAAESVTDVQAALMMREARGLFGLALSAERCSALRLEPQGFDLDAHVGPAYLTTIDARTGVETGISAADRAHTCRLAAHPQVRAEDFARPGHVQPLRARPGGVLVRAGTTEAAVDLCTLAGLRPAAVICNIHDDAGELARRADLLAFARRHGLKFGTITELIRHRLRRERIVERLDRRPLDTPWGTFDLTVYAGRVDELPHLALSLGGIGRPGPDGRVPEVADPVLVRVHSECLTGEVFGSLRCECGPQLDTALRRIAAEGRGVLVYLRQEGRGIGLADKLHAYRLQEAGRDTVQANEDLGLPADKRDYGIGSQILRDLGLRRLRLLSNNPSKIYGLEGYGLEVVERLPCRVEPGDHNRAYLETKRDKMGHLLEGL